MSLTVGQLPRAAFLVAVIICLADCTAYQKPSVTETTLANFAKDIVIPIEAEDLQNPLTVTPQTTTSNSATETGPGEIGFVSQKGQVVAFVPGFAELGLFRHQIGRAHV